MTGAGTPSTLADERRGSDRPLPSVTATILRAIDT